MICLYPSLPVRQMSIKSYLPSKKIYLSWTTEGNFFFRAVYALIVREVFQVVRRLGYTQKYLAFFACNSVSFQNGVPVHRCILFELTA